MDRKVLALNNDLCGRNRVYRVSQLRSRSTNPGHGMIALHFHSSQATPYAHGTFFKPPKSLPCCLLTPLRPTHP